jgi:hypothetical protein
MNRKISFVIVMIMCLVLCMGSDGCKEDPTSLELAKGKNLDVSKMEGEVIALGVGYYLGDQEHTKDLVGKPYYWAKISYLNVDNQSKTETFKGLLPEIHDTLEKGMKLPGSRLFLALTHLAKMDGYIIDMQCSLKEDWFCIVIKDLEGIPKTYVVDKITYYKIKGMLQNDFGLPLKLPLDIAIRKQEM